MQVKLYLWFNGYNEAELKSDWANPGNPGVIWLFLMIMRRKVTLIWTLIFLINTNLCLDAVRSRLHRGSRGKALDALDENLRSLSLRGSDSEPPTRTYMIEYRGHYRDFRELEFFDSLEYTLGISATSTDAATSTDEALQRNWDNRRLVIPDKSCSDISLCMYLNVTARMDVVALAANRCSMLRSASITWGEGSTAEEANQNCIQNFDDIIAPTYHIEVDRDKIDSSKSNNWRVSSSLP